MAYRTSLVAAVVTAATVAAGARDVPAPVAGYPIGWCIRANAQAFADAKAAGFEYVELAMQDVLGLAGPEFAALRDALNAQGLDAFSGYNAIPADLRLVGTGADARSQDEHFQHVLTRAKALGLESIILNSGASWRVQDDVPAEQAFSELMAVVQRFAGAASKAGIGLLIGPLRSTDSNMITTITEAIRLVEAVNRPNVALMVDYSFLRIQKDDLSLLLDARPLLKHVHIANPEGGRTYPMDPAESDYAAFFNVLKEIGYRGRFSVHARTSSFAADAPRAITFLRTEAKRLTESRDR
jgi:D-psicose/D-tagatose/L-ribulose 3-epimerase